MRAYLRRLAAWWRNRPRWAEPSLAVRYPRGIACDMTEIRSARPQFRVVGVTCTGNTTADPGRMRLTFGDSMSGFGTVGFGTVSFGGSRQQWRDPDDDDGNAAAVTS